jgi:hypothetical protein
MALSYLQEGRLEACPGHAKRCVRLRSANKRLDFSSQRIPSGTLISHRDSFGHEMDTESASMPAALPRIHSIDGKILLRLAMDVALQLHGDLVDNPSL